MSDTAPGSDVSIEFCGVVTEHVPLPFDIGRDADLSIDDNPFMHRRFLRVFADEARPGAVLLANVGSQLTATVSDEPGRMEAHLGPGAVLPLVFATTLVRFSAGPTSYELEISLADTWSAPDISDFVDSGETTVGRVSFTVDQTLLVLALAESALRFGGAAVAQIPSSSAAARRLGWTTTKFNRKLDNVCQRLTQMGVRGLHGGAGNLASNRRARLVEYALAVRIVTKEDLAVLDAAVAAAASDSEAT